MSKCECSQLASEFESVAVFGCAAAKLQTLLRGISPSSDGLLTRCLHFALGILAMPINAVSELRRSFKCGYERLPVPVISVGNLTYGGSGKSPFCRWLAGLCLREGFKVGVVLPAHGALSKRTAASLTEDELLEHSHYLPHVPIAMGRRREEASRRLIEENGCDLILLDDGFQYRLLHRDIDIVLIDAVHGLHKFCPMLREPLSALKRANIICLTKVSAARMLIGDEHLNAVESFVKKVSGLHELVKVDFVPTDFVKIATWEALPRESLADAKVIGVVGTAEPYSFFVTLRQLGVDVSRLFIFEDHHQYAPSEVLSICDAARSLGADAIITTLKDAVRLRKAMCEPVNSQARFNNWYAVRIDVCIVDGAQVIEEKICELKSNWLRGANT